MKFLIKLKFEFMKLKKSLFKIKNNQNKIILIILTSLKKKIFSKNLIKLKFNNKILKKN